MYDTAARLRTANTGDKATNAAPDDRTEPDRASPRGPAATIAARVREGSAPTSEAVEAALRAIAAENWKVNACTVVRVERALAEAQALNQRADLDVLPLAGVPVAVEHTVAVAGETVLAGSAATDDAAACTDHPVVRRLREAGAVIVALTAVPELGLWPTTDAPDRITRNPWNTARTTGGAAGGAGAAVAAGLVPIAHGGDGFGALRIPAACCGVFGIKPGRHTVPGAAESWSGLAEHGVLATTVGDAALALSVLAARPDLAETDPPERLRIGLALTPPARVFRVDRYWSAAAHTAAATAAAAGHLVQPVTLPYSDALLAVFLRWLAAGVNAAALPHPERLQRRTRTHLGLGRLVQRLRLVRAGQLDLVEARLSEFFERYDVVITPALAGPPPRARAWHAASWLTNILACVRFSPFTPLWNLVGWPAAVLPMGTHPGALTPVAAQLAGPPGSETTLLRLAAQLESLRPWRRTVDQPAAATG
ncbi:amidase [Nocardia panacis]|uniref:amidase n=1 Tax=Nocardia panacis TaxID=2340916 RepID=A0A3A4KPR8_9NOCA|nr:amidase family protein [Nocardia panacis]RJO77896.1 amidase [Nocardia panacis]